MANLSTDSESMVVIHFHVNFREKKNLTLMTKKDQRVSESVLGIVFESLTDRSINRLFISFKFHFIFSFKFF